MNHNLLLFRFLGLIAAHFIADFPLNTAWLAKGKRRNKGLKRLGYLLGHCLIVASLSYIFIFGWRSRVCLGLAAAVGFCHLAVDYTRLYAESFFCKEGAPAIPEGTILSGRGGGDWCWENSMRWWAVNIGDQAAHLLCIIVIVWLPLFRS